MKENSLTWEKIKNFFLERKYGLWVLLWIVQVVWYFVLNTYQTGSHLIHIPLDDKIPYIKYFVIPYVLWYAYIVFAHIWTYFHSKREFLLMCSLIFLSNFLSMLVCTFYPSMHDLRPAEEMIGTDFFGSIVRWLYGTENPYCILPSQHCMLAIAITFGLITSDSLKNNLAVKIVLPIYTVLVMLSTVFIKQHSIVDVFAAMVMCIPAILISNFAIVPKRRFMDAPAAEPIPATDSPIPAEAVVAAEVAPADDGAEALPESAEVAADEVKDTEG